MNDNQCMIQLNATFELFFNLHPTPNQTATNRNPKAIGYKVQRVSHAIKQGLSQLIKRCKAHPADRCPDYPPTQTRSHNAIPRPDQSGPKEQTSPHTKHTRVDHQVSPIDRSVYHHPRPVRRGQERRAIPNQPDTKQQPPHRPRLIHSRSTVPLNDCSDCTFASGRSSDSFAPLSTRISASLRSLALATASARSHSATTVSPSFL
jgi:hypothetical protein